MRVFCAKKLIFLNMPKEVREKVKLSKSVLEMKFMKRSKIKAEAEEDAIEGSSMYSRNISDGMKNAVDKYVFEESFIPFENLINRRLSFKGMNPEIEKLMANQQSQPPPVNRDMDKDISDEAMAKYNAGLSHTIAKKFSRRQRKKTKFLKPKGDDV